MTSPTLPDLLSWLHARLGDAELFRTGRDPGRVQHLALALEPGDLPPHPSANVLFLHRAFRLGAAHPGLPVLASHDGFDAALTTGVNRALADRLGWTALEEVTKPKGARGLIATPPEQSWDALLHALDAELGGHDFARAPSPQAGLKVALMNAMRPELMDLARQHGAGVYLTGELRRGALARAGELGVGVVALGHGRTELWGLRHLAGELEAAFPGLEARAYAGALQ